jgi:hypothetical protein
MSTISIAATRTSKSALTRWIVWAVIGALCAFVQVRFHTTRGELPVYMVGAQHMLEGGGLYSRASDPVAHTPPFTYPPFFAFIFIPIALLPQSMQSAVWAAAFSAALVSLLWLLYRCFEPILHDDDAPSATRLAVFWSLVALLSARHVLSIVESQSHDVIVLLLIMAGVHASLRNRDGAAGLWTGLAAACKATPLLFAPVFILQHRWRAAVSFVIAAMAATLIPDLLTPAADHTPWIVNWEQTFLGAVKVGMPADESGAWPKWNELNQSLSGTTYRLLNPPPAAAGAEALDASVCHCGPVGTKYLTLAAQLAVLGVVVWGNWPRSATRELTPREQRLYMLGQSAIVVTAMTLLSPMSSKSHFGILLLPISFCFVQLLYRRPDALVASMMAVVFLGTLSVKGLLGRTAGQYVLTFGPVTWCTVACLVASARSLQLIVSSRVRQQRLG